MDPTTIPASLNIRLRPEEAQALATVAAAITTPHRRAATVTEAVRAALSIAAGVVQARPATERPDPA